MSRFRRGPPGTALPSPGHPSGSGRGPGEGLGPGNLLVPAGETRRPGARGGRERGAGDAGPRPHGGWRVWRPAQPCSGPSREGARRGRRASAPAPRVPSTAPLPSRPEPPPPCYAAPLDFCQPPRPLPPEWRQMERRGRRRVPLRRFLGDSFQRNKRGFALTTGLGVLKDRSP